MSKGRKGGERWGMGTAFHPSKRRDMSERARKIAAAWSKPKPVDPAKRR